MSFLDSRFKKVDQADSGALREITLLREYPTCRIADVITGKPDVHEAAARPPDEPKEPEALSDVEADLAGEEDNTEYQFEQE